MYTARKSVGVVLLCTIFLAYSCPVSALTHDTASPLEPIKEESAPKKTTPKKSRNTPQRSNKEKKATRKNPVSTTEKRATVYNRITSFSFSGSSPCAVLRKRDGSEVILPFEKEDEAFVIDTGMGAIPSGTRFTVPDGYKAYCIESHTKRLNNGKAFRAEYDGRPMVLYDSGSEVEYTANSGMVIVPSSFASNPVQKTVKSPVAYETDISDVTIAKDEPEYDNRSEKPEDVIATYDIPENEKGGLIRMHKEAMRMISKEERAERYVELFEHYNLDYLAAYYKALAEFDMSHGGTCIEWCDKALSINPKYLPAKRLRKKAMGII